MDLHELRVAARLIDGLAKRALFAEKQMVALEGQCAEWKRIADELKAERNALRSTTIDTATGRLLDAFGSLANEPRHGATDDEYRDRIVTKIHTIKLERDALRAECDDLRRVFAVVHGSLGIQQGEHIGNAIDALKKERDDHWQREGIEKCRRIDVEAQLSDILADIGALLGVDGGVRSITAAIEKLKERNVKLAAERERMKAELAVVRDERDTLRTERDGLMIQVQDMRAEVAALQERLRASIARGDFAQMEVAALKSQTPKQHPVAVGEWVRRTDAECDGIYVGRGVIAQVIDIHDAPEKQYTVSRPEWNGYCVPWAMQYCEPCDPPEATHDTSAGKQAAEEAVKREPKPGDVVRLVRVPTMEEYADWDDEFGGVGSLGVVKSLARQVANVKYNDFTWEWPISCVEIVEDAK